MRQHKERASEFTQSASGRPFTCHCWPDGLADRQLSLTWPGFVTFCNENAWSNSERSAQRGKANNQHAQTGSHLERGDPLVERRVIGLALPVGQVQKEASVRHRLDHDAAGPAPIHSSEKSASATPTRGNGRAYIIERT